MTDLSRIRESALTLLTRREYGAQELKQRLIDKGYELSLIDEALQELSVQGLQSDQRFVESYIGRRMRKGFGPLHITQELQRLIINQELIEEHLTSCETQWKEVVKMLAQRKFGSTTLAREMKMRVKQIRFLQSRGFHLFQIIQYLTESVDE